MAGRMVSVRIAGNEYTVCGYESASICRRWHYMSIKHH